MSKVTSNVTSSVPTVFELEEIEHSGLFNVDFYLSQAPDAVEYATGPAAHYLEIGSGAGLSPNWLFDPQYYVSCNPDVVNSGMNPLLHFIISGAEKGFNPHPLFDVPFYLSEYPEVAKSGINPLLHYLRIGSSERANPHPLFDTSFYLDQAPADFARSENPLLHFIENWSSNLVNPHPLFDMSFYLRMNPDLVETKVNPLLHYVIIGARSGRDPHPLFDTAFYLEQQPKTLGEGDNPLVHFLKRTGSDGADPHPLFDVSFYLQMYPNVKAQGVNPLCHFLQYGASEQKDPSAFFDTAYYLANYPSAQQSGLNPLTNFLLEGASLGYDPSPLFDSSFYLQSYLALDSVYQSLVATEPHKANPLLHYARYGRFEKRLTRRAESDWRLLDGGAPQLVCGTDDRLESSYLKLLAAIARPCKHLFLLGCLMRGGAERSACHCIQFAAGKASSAEDILVVVTDVANLTCVEWLPENTRLLNLAELYPKLAQYDMGALLMRLIADTKAKTVHVFNSPRAYAAIGYYFDCYPRPSARILSYLCGYELYTDFNFSGFSDGALYHAANHVDLMITDNERLCKTIIETYKHVPSIESKAVTCYQPLMASLREELSASSSLTDERNSKQKVLWASRIDATKRPDILARIAQLLPDVQFEVFGYSSGGYDYSYLRRLKNITLMGEYSDFGRIAKNNIGAFLYTSDADGMPNVLLEAIASGLPVVAPHVGGIGELITNDTGWLVGRFDDIEHYVRLLKYVLSHRPEAERRATNAQSLLSQRHSWSAFTSRLSGLGIT